MKSVCVRVGSRDDAEEFLTLRRGLDMETELMLLEPGERNWSLEEQQRRFDSALRDGLLLLAQADGVLAGFLFARRGEYQRQRHVIDLGVGVRKAFWGRGIATQMFSELDSWALGRDILRIELMVMAHNSRAVGLYRRLGFVVEGVKRAALRIGDTYVDELIMAKWLDGDFPGVSSV
jgi:RimJ/RimL family protein N-acetyltransferase